MYCTHCFANLFKDDPRVSQMHKKTKETQWVNYIVTHLPLEGWVWDRSIYVDFSGGCCATKRRIDLRIMIDHPDKGLFWLGIEIDEHEHKSYAADYEESRYNDLFMDWSGRYVFVRINPDPYRDSEGKRHDPPFEERASQALDLITDIIDKGPSGGDLVVVHHLFYSGGDGQGN